MKTLARLLILKLVSLCLVGTCWAQDKVVVFADAVAHAEGFYRKGSIPNRFHNPGDLKARPGEKYPGQVRIGKGGHVIFRSDAAGWAALYHQIDKALAGESHFYRQDMTISAVAKRYAANYRLWARNVSRALGVAPSTTLEEFFELPPKVTYDMWASTRAPVQ
jgi:hypothetical protein